MFVLYRSTFKLVEEEEQHITSRSVFYLAARPKNHVIPS